MRQASSECWSTSKVSWFSFRIITCPPLIAQINGPLKCEACWSVERCVATVTEHLAAVRGSTCSRAVNHPRLIGCSASYICGPQLYNPAAEPFTKTFNTEQGACHFFQTNDTQRSAAVHVVMLWTILVSSVVAYCTSVASPTLQCSSTYALLANIYGPIHPFLPWLSEHLIHAKKKLYSVGVTLYLQYKALPESCFPKNEWGMSFMVDGVVWRHNMANRM